MSPTSYATLIMFDVGDTSSLPEIESEPNCAISSPASQSTILLSQPLLTSFRTVISATLPSYFLQVSFITAASHLIFMFSLDTVSTQLFFPLHAHRILGANLRSKLTLSLLLLFHQNFPPQSCCFLFSILPVFSSLLPLSRFLLGCIF